MWWEESTDTFACRNARRVSVRNQSSRRQAIATCSGARMRREKYETDSYEGGVQKALIDNMPEIISHCVRIDFTWFLFSLSLSVIALASASTLLGRPALSLSLQQFLVHMLLYLIRFYSGSSHSMYHRQKREETLHRREERNEQ